MKTPSRLFLFCAAVCVTACLPLAAQPDRGGEPSRPGPDGREQDRRPGNRSHPMVGRYLMHLKETNPKEYERLNNLRESDPQAFRRALHTKITHKRQEALHGRHPEIPEILAALPPDRREQLERILYTSSPAHKPPSRRQAFSEQNQKKIANQLQALREAKGSEERNNIEEKLREELRQIHAQSLRERSERIEQISEELTALRKTLSVDEQQREAWVDAQLNQLRKAARGEQQKNKQP